MSKAGTFNTPFKQRKCKHSYSDILYIKEIMKKRSRILNSKMQRITQPETQCALKVSRTHCSNFQKLEYQKYLPYIMLLVMKSDIIELLKTVYSPLN